MQWALLAQALGCANPAPSGDVVEDSGTPGTLEDADGDGFSSALDCDDTQGAVYPGASEICDGLDNDCNGVIDDDAEDLTTNRVVIRVSA